MLSAKEAKKMSASSEATDAAIKKVAAVIAESATRGMQEVTLYTLYNELNTGTKNAVKHALADNGFDLISPSDESKLHISWA